MQKKHKKVENTAEDRASWSYLRYCTCCYYDTTVYYVTTLPIKKRLPFEWNMIDFFAEIIFVKLVTAPQQFGIALTLFKWEYQIVL